MTQKYGGTPKRDETCIDGRDGSQTIRVAGVSFRPGYPDNLLNLGNAYPEGQLIELELKREPTNPYDENAIMVLLKKTGEHVGYIPKALNLPWVEHLDAGGDVVARVDEVVVSKKGGGRQPGLLINVKRAGSDPALSAPAGG